MILEVRREMPWWHKGIVPHWYGWTPEEELAALKYRKEHLELELKYINERIAELEKLIQERKQ